VTIATPSGSHKPVTPAQRVPLTDARCRSYPAPSTGRVTLSDFGKGWVPGLQLRITAEGTRTFKTRSSKNYTGKLRRDRLREPLTVWEIILRKAAAGISGVVTTQA
jgi:hypothetical protein